MILLMLQVLSLLLSFLGYFIFIQKKGLHIAFAPILTVSGISVVLFFAGILNILPLAVWTIYLAGLFLAIYYFAGFVRHTSTSAYISSIFSPSLLPVFFFAVLYCLFVLRVRNAVSTHYDNFTHWLLVIKDMLRSDQLPSFQSTMVGYRSYPTGSANFIYYVCKVTGPFEGFMLLGQNILHISCLTVFWAFAKKSYKASGIIILLSSLYLLSANSVVTDFTVDSLLALVGIAAFSTIIYYKDNLHKCTVCNCVIGAFLVLVKNSGIFFVAVHSLLLAILWFSSAKQQSRRMLSKEPLLPLGISIAVPLSICYLWNRHVDYAFPHDKITEHSMTVENYTNILNSRSPEDLRAISVAFFDRLTEFGPEASVLIVLVCLYLVYFLLNRKKEHIHSHTPYFIWSIFVYISYLAGLLAMYLLSMPIGEALYMASYDRYIGTITMYLIGIAIVYMLTSLEDPLPQLRVASAILSLCLLIGSVWGQLGYLFYRSGSIEFSSDTRERLLQIIEDYDLREGASYHIITSDGVSAGYHYYLVKCDLWTMQITYGYEPPFEKINDVMSFDYLIVMNQNEDTLRFLAQAGLPAGEGAYDLSQYR